MNLPNCKAPCNMCPMRKDILPGWQCAGHMLMRGDKNDFVALAARIDIPTGLIGRNLVFDTEQDCIAHHDFDNA